MVFRQLQVSTLVFSFTVLYYKKKAQRKMSSAAFRTKIIAKQDLPVSELSIYRSRFTSNYRSANTIFPPVAQGVFCEPGRLNNLICKASELGTMQVCSLSCRFCQENTHRVENHKCTKIVRC